MYNFLFDCRFVCPLFFSVLVFDAYNCVVLIPLGNLVTDFCEFDLVGFFPMFGEVIGELVAVDSLVSIWRWLLLLLVLLNVLFPNGLMFGLTFNEIEFLFLGTVWRTNLDWLSIADEVGNVVLSAKNGSSSVCSVLNICVKAGTDRPWTVAWGKKHLISI